MKLLIGLLDCKKEFEKIGRELMIYEIPGKTIADRTIGKLMKNRCDRTVEQYVDIEGPKDMMLRYYD